jgi:putative PIN family toxin of toxin-antitoxin system
MRIVVDTNVFVGACIGVGASNLVIRYCLQGRALPLMGNPLYSEYEDVLARTTLFNKSRLNAVERDELFDIFAGTCEWVRVYFQWRPNLRDEADNHLIELAVAGGASHVVTRNLRDLVSGELAFPNVKILTPEQFLKEIQP